MNKTLDTLTAPVEFVEEIFGLPMYRRHDKAVVLSLPVTDQRIA